MSHVTDFDHRRLDAMVYSDCIVEVHRVSDIALGLRKVAVTKIWRTERILGRGAFGEVQLQVQDKDPESKRALKVIPTRERMSNAECERELTALIEFTKPKYKDEAVFVAFLGWFQTENAMYLAMEYIPLGDLESNLRELEKSRGGGGYPEQQSGGVVPEDEVKDITIQILEGVKIMHAEGFAHRDLKPQNVLVVRRKPRWWVKLGDFGLSKKMTEATAYRSRAGTESYMAPELFYYIQSSSPESLEYTNAIDIWALGCIAHRTLTGKPPFSDLYSLKEYCSKPKLPVFLGGAENFIERLLKPNPKERLTAGTALEHPWLNMSEHISLIAVARSSPISTDAIANDVLKAVPNHSEQLTTNMESSQSQFDYNTASHAGLRTRRLLNTSESTPVRPLAESRLPIVDSPQTHGPVLDVLNAKQFNYLRLSGGTATAVEEKQKQGVEEKQRNALKENLVHAFKGKQIPTEEEGQKQLGSKMASASDESTVSSWDSAARTVCHILNGHSRWVNAVVFSPDGKLVASASEDKTVRLWNPSTGAARHTLKGHSRWVNAVAFSPDSKLVASASEDKTVRLWNAATGELRHTLKGHSDQVKAIVFSPDGKLVASASWDKTVRLWDSETGSKFETLKSHSDRVEAVAFSPDGKLVASSAWDMIVRLWDSATGAVRHMLKGHSGHVEAVAFSPDGTLVASASGDKTVRLWNTATGEVCHTLKGHSRWVEDVAFSPDGKLVASASWDMTVKLWDSATGATCHTLKGHSGWVNAVAFSPDGKLVASASEDKTIKLWSTMTGTVCHTLEGHLRWVGDVAFSPNGKLVASASWDMSVRLWTQR